MDHAPSTSEPQLESQSLPDWLAPAVTNYVVDLKLRRQARDAQRALDEITYERTKSGRRG